MIVACQWKRSSPFGPALQLDGGSRLILANSCAEIHARGDYTQIGAWPCRARGGGRRRQPPLAGQTTSGSRAAAFRLDHEQLFSQRPTGHARAGVATHLINSTKRHCFYTRPRAVVWVLGGASALFNKLKGGRSEKATDSGQTHAVSQRSAQRTHAAVAGTR